VAVMHAVARLTIAAIVATRAEGNEIFDIIARISVCIL